MKIFNLPAFILFAFSFIACKSVDKKAELSEKSETDSATVNNLKGHVYFFGPAFDSTICDVIAECDCCYDDFLFLNDKDFMRVGYCVAVKSIIKGTYTTGQDNIILQYDSLIYFNEADINNEIKTVSKESSEYLIKSEKIIPSRDTLTKFNCKELLFYINSNEK
jgi:hypothetical protein